MSHFSNTDLTNIWTARWRKTPIKKLVAKYDVDPRRFYEVWEEEKYPGSREIAMEIFKNRHPQLAKTTDFNPHKPQRKVVALASDDNSQLELF